MPLTARLRQHRRSIATYAVVCVLSALLALAARELVADPFVVSGASMQPTLHDGQRLLVSPLAAHVQGVHRGDLIVFDGNGRFADPGRPDRLLVKRAVALAGDTVSADSDGRVLVNGQPVPEPYVQGVTAPFDEVTVPPGAVFVLGDNRENSWDSRVSGPVWLSWVVGVAWWPLH